MPFLFLGVTASPGLAIAASEMPPLKATRWVNSTPLTPEALRGKVVLVDFWEFTCINWIRTSPYVKAWNRDYAKFGLVVIGVHAPEFEFGKQPEIIDRGIRDHGLTYPIAIDNDFVIWNAFDNDAWPAKYLFDAQGNLVMRWVGEGSYDQIESEIRRLLLAANPGTQAAASQPRSERVREGRPALLRRDHRRKLRRRAAPRARHVQAGRRLAKRRRIRRAAEAAPARSSCRSSPAK